MLVDLACPLGCGGKDGGRYESNSVVEPSSNQQVAGRMKIGYAIDTHASYVA
ncbi:hypothetical protein [Cupriavidus sp. TMH.W2]|uniref:hypothetical protein n=1 Tax=Cupriavidus sp. TMH.W2 TaxID=3434465 RepID=UPI003D77FFEA